MQALAALGIEKQPIKNGKQPGAQRLGFALLVSAAQGAFDGGLDQIIGTAGLTSQPQGKAAQALQQLTPLLFVQIVHGQVPGAGVVSVGADARQENLFPPRE